MTRVRYERFTIYNTDGSIAGILDGDYEAVKSEGSQAGWYKLFKVKPDGTLASQPDANFNIFGGGT